MYFAFIFSERITITSSKDAVKLLEHSFIRKYKQKVVLLVFYLANYDLSKLTLLMYNTAFDDVLSTASVKQTN